MADVLPSAKFSEILTVSLVCAFSSDPVPREISVAARPAPSTMASVA